VTVFFLRAHIYQCIYICLYETSKCYSSAKMNKRCSHSCFSLISVQRLFLKVQSVLIWLLLLLEMTQRLHKMCFSMTIPFIFSASSRGSTDALFLTLWCEDGMPRWTNSANVFLQTVMFAWIISPFAHAESWTLYSYP